MNRIIELIFCMVECYKGIYGITEPVNITNKFYENEKKIVYCAYNHNISFCYYNTYLFIQLEQQDQLVEY